MKMAAKEIYLKQLDDMCAMCKYTKYCFGCLHRQRLESLIDQRFNTQLTRNECDFIIDCLKPLEEECGMDITLLIDKINKHKYMASRQEGVVECVEFE